VLQRGVESFLGVLMAAPAAVLSILVNANTKAATASLAKTQTQLNATGAASAKNAKMMKAGLAGVGIAAGAAAVGLVKLGGDFEKSYDKIRVGTGKTGKGLERLKAGFKDVVSSVPADFDDAATAVADLNTRLGLTGRQNTKVSKQMLELSRITGTSVAGNVKGVARAFVDWDVATKDTSSTLDGFFRLSQESGASVQELTTNVQKFGSPLRQLGWDLEESAAMFATFERAGVNTETMVPGLKFAIANLTKGTGEAGEMMEKFGIKAGEPESALRKVFKIMSDDGVKASDRIKLAMAAFGQRAGPDMAEAIKQGRFEVDDMVATMTKGSDTIRDAGRDSMSLGDNWKLLTNQMKVGLEPAATALFGVMNDGLAWLSKNAPKAVEAIKQFFATNEDAKGLISAFGDIGKAIGSIGNSLLPVVEKMLPFVKDTLKAMVRVFRGFVDVVAGILTLDLGRVLGGLGDIVGGSFQRMIAIARGLWEPVKAAFKAIGNAITAPFKTAFKFVVQIGKDLLDDLLGLFTGVLDGIAAVADKLGGLPLVGGKFDGVAESIRGATGALNEQREGLRKHGDALDKDKQKVKAHAQEGQKNWSSYSTGADKSLATVRTATGKTGNKASDDLNKVGQASKDTGKRVDKNVRGLGKTVGRALKSVGENTNEALRAFNAPKLSFSFNTLEGDTKQLFARKGAMVPGHGSGDKVPAMLEPGEVVLNREAVKRLGGPQRAHQVNRMIPRFARGGIVGLGKKLQGLGWLVSEHPAFGGVQGRHSDGSYHYSNQAIDVNWPNPGQEASKIRALLPSLEAISGIIELLHPFNDPAHAGSNSHLHIAMGSGAGFAGLGGMVAIAKTILKGPPGPMRDIGQGSVDKARKAANKFLAAQTLEGVEAGASADGNVERIFARVAKRVGTSKTSKLALGMAGYAESGMRDLNYGDSTSLGALQLLASTASALGVSPHDEGAIASLFMLRGFAGRGGANANADRGLPAHLVAQAVQGSAFSSGSNYLAQKGPAMAWMQRFGLQRGGIVGYQKGGGPSLPKGWPRNPFKDPAGTKQLTAASSAWKRLRRVYDRLPRIQERIGFLESQAGRPGSELGVELGPGEITRQVAAQEFLLGRLVKIRELSKRGLRLIDFGLKRAKPGSQEMKRLRKLRPNFQEKMTEMTGLTGKTGSIYETKLAIEALKTTAVEPPPKAEPMNISELLDVIQAARYGVFNSKLPKFHSGGVYRAPAGQSEGPAILRHGETVTPAGSGPRVVINIAEGMGWLREFIDVQLDEQNREADLEVRVGGRI
jgi:TP901 family phage tail tape measure protein